MSQLYSETGDVAFADVIARIEPGQGDRINRYIEMVEENVIREDLTFAEMAQVAITAAQDNGIEDAAPGELVNRLYGALHETKRSYIRGFVLVLTELGDALAWPKEVARNLGVDVARCLKDAEAIEGLRLSLRNCASPEAQNKILGDFVLAQKSGTPVSERKAEPKQKFEFFVGGTKVTARQGECRIVSERDFATLPKALLEEAVKAFETTLKNGSGMR